MDITYRPLRKEDHAAVNAIIEKTWYDPEIVEGSYTERHYNKAVLYNYLLWTNFTLVAECEGKIAGFIFGRCDTLPCFRYYLHNVFRMWYERAALLFSRAGRIELENIRITDKADFDLLREHAHEFDGELCLFDVAEGYQKHGIGRELIRRFNDFMRDNGAHSYYLYTDTYCNTEFYDHNDFMRISAETVNFVDENDGESLPVYYLYKYDLGITENERNACMNASYKSTAKD